MCLIWLWSCLSTMSTIVRTYVSLIVCVSISHQLLCRCVHQYWQEFSRMSWSICWTEDCWTYWCVLWIATASSTILSKQLLPLALQKPLMFCTASSPSHWEPVSVSYTMEPLIKDIKNLSPFKRHFSLPCFLHTYNTLICKPSGQPLLKGKKTWSQCVLYLL